MSRPTFLRVIPTRRPLVYVVNDLIVRFALALLVLVVLGYAWQAGKMLLQVVR